MVDRTTIDLALFLAAGQGARLRPYTVHFPKPMIPFLGLPLLYHSLDFLSQSIGERINLIINLHHHAAMLEGFIQTNKNTLPIKCVRFSHEKEQLLDSGGALAQVEPLLTQASHFWVCNADEVIISRTLEFSFSKMIETHKQNGNLATLLVINSTEVGKSLGGAWCDDAFNIKQFSKEVIFGLKGWHYVGMMLLSREVFNYVSKPPRPENILYDVITRAIHDGRRVQVFPAELEWFETGVLNLFKANELKLKRQLAGTTDQWAMLKARLNRYPQFPNIIT